MCMVHLPRTSLCTWQSWVTTRNVKQGLWETLAKSVRQLSPQQCPSCENILGCLSVSQGAVTPATGDSRNIWRSTKSDEVPREPNGRDKCKPQGFLPCPELKRFIILWFSRALLFHQPSTEVTEMSHQFWKGQHSFLKNWFSLQIPWTSNPLFVYSNLFIHLPMDK